MVWPINEEGSLVCATRDHPMWPSCAKSMHCGHYGACTTGKATSTLHPIDSQEAPADQNASQGQECLVNVRPFFTADAQSSELVQPCEAPLDKQSHGQM